MSKYSSESKLKVAKFYINKIMNIKKYTDKT